jgi:hypothetical protein
VRGASGCSARVQLDNLTRFWVMILSHAVVSVDFLASFKPKAIKITVWSKPLLTSIVHIAWPKKDLLHTRPWIRPALKTEITSTYFKQNLVASNPDKLKVLTRVFAAFRNVDLV